MAAGERVRISNRSGAIRVSTAPGAALSVDGAPVTRDEDGTWCVRCGPGSSSIEVTCADGTDLVIGTVSGHVDVQGSPGAVRIATVSGKIAVEQAARLDVRAKSGHVEVGRCTGDCHVVVTSSRVEIGEAGKAVLSGISGRLVVDELHDAEVKTVSGDVTLGARGGGRIAVRTVSGGVEVELPPDSAPHTRLTSVSGHVECECPQGDDGEVRVATVSGRVKVSCR